MDPKLNNADKPRRTKATNWMISCSLAFGCLIVNFVHLKANGRSTLRPEMWPSLIAGVPIVCGIIAVVLRITRKISMAGLSLVLAVAIAIGFLNRWIIQVLIDSFDQRISRQNVTRVNGLRHRMETEPNNIDKAKRAKTTTWTLPCVLAQVASSQTSSISWR